MQIFISICSFRSPHPIPLRWLKALFHRQERSVYVHALKNFHIRHSEHLFTYHALRINHSIDWVTYESPNISVQYIITGVKPETVLTRLQSDLSFGYEHLKSDFKGYMKHSLKLIEAFKPLNIFPTTKPTHPAGENGTPNTTKKSKSKPTESSTSAKQGGHTRTPH